jgi:hypothetical protein
MMKHYFNKSNVVPLRGVIAHHNEVKDELGFLVTLATSPNVVSDEQFLGCAANGKSNCESNTCPHLQSPNTMKGIEVIYYFEEFGKDKHIMLWKFVSQMLLSWDHISYQLQIRFYVVMKWRRKEMSSGLYGPTKTFHSVCKLY